MMKPRSLLALLFCTVLIVGCATPPGIQPSATSGVSIVPAQSTPAPIMTEMPQPTEATEEQQQYAKTPALDVSTLCPAETEGATLYLSTENGVCFLYPVGFEMQPDVMRPDKAVILRGPSLTSGMDRLWVTLNVDYNGPADGLDSAHYVEKWMELTYPGEHDLYPRDLGVTQEEAVIGETAATVMGNLPGFSPQRSAFIVANGIKYRITQQPQPQDLPELAEAAQQVWDTVTESIVFFPPQNTRPVVRPEDVCPNETEDNRLVVNLTGGYCLLYPADFAPDPEFPAAIIGGAELGPVEGFDSLRASLAVSSYGLGEQSPEQALQPISEQIDTISVMTTTIGGYPAVIFDFTGGPWRQRNAQVLVGDTVYTFVGQPWDADKYPQALPDVERLWQTVSESIAFFDKWQ
jgi:hypothetical protein